MLKRATLLMSLLFALLTVVSAQDITPQDPPQDADLLAITFPPPVYVLTDIVEIRGSANVTGFDSYRVEYRELQLGPDALPDEQRPWLVATLPSDSPVQNDVLGRWNTTTTDDGLYEIRLRVFLADGADVIYRVSPLRVINETPFELVGGNDTGGSTRPTLAPTPTQIGNVNVVRPTLLPSPTPLATGDPIVTAQVDANVRRGDSTAYPIVGALLTGESARIVGVSSRGNGWYYVELENGRRGFVAPSIVNVTGSVSNLARINPPATPTPPATATPVTVANLQITGLRLEPNTPRCGESYDLFINITNSGTGPTNSSGIISIVDRHVASGTTTANTQGGFPVLQPGENFVVTASLTSNTFFEEEHQVVLTVDARGEIPETNEGDNTRTQRYTLQRAGCS
jgi:hypothetical protein